VVDAGGRVVIPATMRKDRISRHQKDAVKLSLDQEIHVTNQVNGLVELAPQGKRSQRDQISCSGFSPSNWKRFLRWTIT